MYHWAIKSLSIGPSVGRGRRRVLTATSASRRVERDVLHADEVLAGREGLGEVELDLRHTVGWEGD
jgi:hypothetical protein